MKQALKINGILFLAIISILSCSNKKPETLQSFKLDEVRLLKEGPFYRAQQADLKYMLALDPDRLLAPYLKDAGITPSKNNYGNWESIGLDGHTAGHYLSALSMMYAATGDKELMDRIDYMVDWLDTCQQKNGNGYVGGVPDGHKLWSDIEKGKVNSGSFSLGNRWVPLYNLHKLYAGLRDVYLINGNTKARDILIKLSDWMYNLTKNLTDDQIQDILKTEQGGINEIFVDVYDITGDKKYLELAKRLSHKAILEPLIEHKNELTGLHANTQIPKVIGFERIGEETGDTSWTSAAKYFWNTVINDWTVSIGGNSVREHFNPPNDFSTMIESNQGPETCNTYNMLKLTKLLYLSDPEKKYIDYYERALFNHILSSEDPKGGFVYFTPMRPEHYRVYSQPQLCFWCCVGSGLENHAKYGVMIYSHTDNDIFVNLFIASTLNWKEKGITLTQNTKFPYEESSEFTINVDEPKEFVLNIRKPSWVKDGEFQLFVNDEKISIKGGTIYVPIKRTWKSGDVVKVKLPMKTSVEYLPDSSNWASIIHGPIVLAAISDSSNLTGLWADGSRMGHVASGPYYPIDTCPVIVTNKKDFSSEVKAIKGKPMTFTIPGLVFPNKKPVVLKPFFDIQEARYIIYWPVTDSMDLIAYKQKLKNQENELLKLEERTVDQVAPGEQQPETDHRFKGMKTESGLNGDKHWRDATGWFSYELNNKNNEGKTLQITYYGLDNGRVFDILLNDVKLVTVDLKGDHGAKFYNVDYAIPDNILEKSKDGLMKIKFVAASGSKAGGIYYIRLLK